MVSYQNHRADLVRMTGLDLIKVRLGRVLGGGAHPRRIEWVRVLHLAKKKREKAIPFGMTFSFSGADDRTRTCTLARWNLNPMSLPIPPHPHIFSYFRCRPVAVPGIFVGDGAPSSAADRGHSFALRASLCSVALSHGACGCSSLRSLTPPLAALPSLPTTSAYIPFCAKPGRVAILSRQAGVVNAVNSGLRNGLARVYFFN